LIVGVIICSIGDDAACEFRGGIFLHQIRNANSALVKRGRVFKVIPDRSESRWNQFDYMFGILIGNLKCGKTHCHEFAANMAIRVGLVAAMRQEPLAVAPLPIA
jgi:hypothetical protein